MSSLETVELCPPHMHHNMCISQLCTIKTSTRERENAHKPQEAVGSHGVELQMAMSHLTRCQVLHKSSKHSLTTEPSLHSTNNNFKRQNYTFIFPRIQNARSLETFAKLHPLTTKRQRSLWLPLKRTWSSDTSNHTAIYKCL